MIESHVTSYNLSKILKELGVKQESIFYWWDEDGSKTSYILVNRYEIGTDENKDYSAFLASELGELLPYVIDDGKQFWYPLYTKQHNYFKISLVSDTKSQLCHKTDKIEANVRAKILIHLIEAALVKAEDLNAK